MYPQDGHEYFMIIIFDETIIRLQKFYLHKTLVFCKYVWQQQNTAQKTWVTAAALWVRSHFLVC